MATSHNSRLITNSSITIKKNIGSVTHRRKAEEYRQRYRRLERRRGSTRHRRGKPRPTALAPSPVRIARPRPPPTRQVCCRAKWRLPRYGNRIHPLQQQSNEPRSNADQPPIAPILLSGGTKSAASMPCPAHLFHIAPRHKSASSSSLAPALSAARRSTSRSLNKHDRIVPSAVIRVRSQSLQNERVTEAMIPTVISVPLTRHSSAGADGSSRPIAANSKRSLNTDSNSAAVTMFSRAQAWSASRGICSMNRNSTPASRHHCKRSAAPWSVSRMRTAFTLSGARPATAAARIPARTEGNLSRRVNSAKCARSTESRETFTRVKPAAASFAARCSSPTALVVMASGIPGTRAAHPAMIFSRSLRISGSPPVNLTSRIPTRSTPIPTTRTISSALRRSSAAMAGKPSSGMQYVQRSEHFSVIETRRSLATRPNLSTRRSVSGRPVREAASNRTVGIPIETTVITSPTSVLLQYDRKPYSVCRTDHTA